MSVGKHLCCKKCKRPSLRGVRGRYGVPVAKGLGVLRLLLCSNCGTKNLSVNMIVVGRNAESIIEAIRQT